MLYLIVRGTGIDGENKEFAIFTNQEERDEIFNKEKDLYRKEHPEIEIKSSTNDRFETEEDDDSRKFILTTMELKPSTFYLIG